MGREYNIAYDEEMVDEAYIKIDELYLLNFLEFHVICRRKDFETTGFSLLENLSLEIKYMIFRLVEPIDIKHCNHKPLASSSLSSNNASLSSSSIQLNNVNMSLNDNYSNHSRKNDRSK